MAEEQYCTHCVHFKNPVELEEGMTIEGRPTTIPVGTWMTRCPIQDRFVCEVGGCAKWEKAPWSALKEEVMTKHIDIVTLDREMVGRLQSGSRIPRLGEKILSDGKYLKVVEVCHMLLTPEDKDPDIQREIISTTVTVERLS